MEKYIGFTKVALPHGWLGNMSPHPIVWNNKLWKTSEALFQALRFDDEAIQEKIRLEKSPMGAKFKAKGNREYTKIAPLSEADLENMKLCVKLKLESHPEIKQQLKNTGTAILFEDVTARPRGNNLFWGAMIKGDALIGENYLGKIWMELRESI
jgi:ribA/ribD-fused uncharacterized protein